MNEATIKQLEREGIAEVQGVGTYRLLPRRQGKTFCGFRNKEGTPRYSKRVRFTISKELRDRLCK